MKLSLAESLVVFDRMTSSLEHSRRLLKSYISTGQLKLYTREGFVGDHSQSSIDELSPPSNKYSWEESDEQEVWCSPALMGLDPEFDWERNVITIATTDTSRMDSISRVWRHKNATFRFEGVSLDKVDVESCAMTAGLTDAAKLVSKSNIGRPTQHDWNGALIELLRLTDIAGRISGKSQTEIAKMIEDYFARTKPGVDVAETSVKDLARRIKTEAGRK